MGNGIPEAKSRERGPKTVIGWPESIKHRIDLLPHPRGYNGAIAFFRGRKIGLFDAPLCEAARWLLREGIASRDDWIGAWRGETPCMAGKAGELAKWTVRETSEGGLYWARYVPMTDEQRAALRKKELGKIEAPLGGSLNHALASIYL